METALFNKQDLSSSEIIVTTRMHSVYRSNSVFRNV